MARPTLAQLTGADPQTVASLTSPSGSGVSGLPSINDVLGPSGISSLPSIAPPKKKKSGGIGGFLHNVGHATVHDIGLAAHDIKAAPGGFLKLGTDLVKGPSLGEVGHEWAQLIEHQKLTTNKNDKLIHQDVPALIKNTEHVVQHPLADPFATLLTLAPVFGTAGKLGIATREGALGLEKGSTFGGRVLKYNGAETPLHHSTQPIMRGLQKAHDVVVQRALDKNPEGRIAGYGTRRIGYGKSETQRYQNLLNGVIADQVEAGKGALQREARTSAGVSRLGKLKPAERAKVAELSQTMQDALRLTSENDLPQNAVKFHLDQAAHHGAEADRIGAEIDQAHAMGDTQTADQLQKLYQAHVAAAPANHEVAARFQKVLDAGIVKDENGHMVIDAAKFPQLAQVDAKIAEAQTHVEDILKKHAGVNEDALRARVNAPNRYRAGAKYVEPTPARLGKVPPRLSALRQREERLAGLHERALDKANEEAHAMEVKNGVSTLGPVNVAIGTKLAGPGKLLAVNGSARAERLGSALSVTRDELAQREAAYQSRIEPTGIVGGEGHVGNLTDLPSKVKVAGEEITVGHTPELRRIAQSFQKTARPTKYVEVDPARAAKIADWYQHAQDAVHDPQTRAAYEAFAKETLDQYNALAKAGYKFEFFPRDKAGNIVDPYPNGPRQAIQDLTQNKHLYVFPDAGGFGTETAANTGHVLLQDSGVRWGGQKVSNNELFRAVHDVFGHGKEGVGFRASGEEAAYQSHRTMYSDLAQKAMASETRGQNSWVNYGPHGEANRTAGQADTVYADQKMVLAPDWVVHEGAAPSEATRPGRNFVDYRTYEPIKGSAPVAATVGPVVGDVKSLIGAKRFKGEGLQHGKVPLDTLRAVHNHVKDAIRYVNTDQFRRSILETGSQTKRTSRDILVRIPDTTKGEIDASTRESLGQVKSTTDAEKLGEVAGFQAWLQDVIPGLKDTSADAGDVGKVAPRGYAWVDRNIVGDLARPLPAKTSYLGGKVNDVNATITAFTVYLKLGHIGTRYLTNASANLIQGSLKPTEFGKSIDLWKQLDDTYRRKAFAVVGQRSYEALPQEGSSMAARLARFGSKRWAKYADSPFRFNSIAYEARKAGFDTPEKFRQMLDMMQTPHAHNLDAATAAKLDWVAKRSDRAAIAYDRLNPTEKRYLTKAIWFYPWIKGSSSFLGHTVAEHPYTAGAMAQAGVLGRQEQAKFLGDMPYYEQGLIPLGKGSHPTVTDFSTFSPFATPADIAQASQHPDVLAGLANPVYGAADSLIHGVDQYGQHTNHPVSSSLSQLLSSVPEAQILGAALHPEKNGANRMFRHTPGEAAKRAALGPAAWRRVNKSALNQSAARSRSGR